MDKEYARRLLAGEIPMENPRIKKPGDPAYYYFDPRGVTEHTKFKDRKLIGVPTADTPNPALADSKKDNNFADQIIGATNDLIKNYFDMKNDNTINADDYFHCKANFEAANRGKYGELTAKYIGDAKERFDYFKNRMRGISAIDAYSDYLHDIDINNQGRQQAKSGLYKNAKEACKYKRVKKINDKY